MSQMRIVRRVLIFVVGLVALSARPTLAQNGPYLATPSWDQTLTCAPGNCPRFVVVMGGAAVLDRETGLVWQQAPSASQTNWAQATQGCEVNLTGNRGGWRLPTFHELTSLLDGSGLPPGHPFSNIQFANPSIGSPFYWSSTNSVDSSLEAINLGFISGGGVVNVTAGKDATLGLSWCVRGGTGVNSSPN